MVIAAQHAGSDGMSPGAVEVQQISLSWPGARYRLTQLPELVG